MRRLLSFLVTSLGVCALVAMGVLFQGWTEWAARPIDASATQSVHVEIPAGSFQSAMDALESSGLIDNPFAFQLLAWKGDRSRKVQAGAFALDPRWSPDELLEKLVNGAPTAQRRLVISEGLNIWQLAHRIERVGIGSASDFLKLAQDWKRATRLGIPAIRPNPALHGNLSLENVHPFEGYLFPLTYALPWNARPEDVITRATARFFEVWEELVGTHRTSYEAVKAEHHLTDHDLVILASLVEKEGIVDAERPLIASVFYNRIREGWKLQTDPTLIYHPEKHTEKPSPTHRRDRSNPYNTYAHRGLPPGPIANPGRASLEAVLAPAESDYFFFVARRDGSRQHAFSKTLDGHRKRIQEHLK